MENLENLWGCLPAIRIASPHFWIMCLLERIIGRITGNYRCVFYFHSKTHLGMHVYRKALRGCGILWMSLSYLRITAILHCTLIGFVGL